MSNFQLTGEVLQAYTTYAIDDLEHVMVSFESVLGLLVSGSITESQQRITHLYDRHPVVNTVLHVVNTVLHLVRLLLELSNASAVVLRQMMNLDQL